MIADLLSTTGAFGAFVLSLLIFGFAPGTGLAAIVRLIPDLDRRRELQAELYEVPRIRSPGCRLTAHISLTRSSGMITTLSSKLGTSKVSGYFMCCASPDSILQRCQTCRPQYHSSCGATPMRSATSNCWATQ